ncbi:MAG: HEAT repeat domain-containing protein [Desulfarculus sp.]|nr:HEAT repeat domain-containing protein [Pseudomonadota bacterium]MBV1718015.1 HEAT repeat domain-containing protein [Desulfarculus sp.]MBU4575455.1 HEAT repeat domain-containing protein [Pseudomonadota bacterium]MBU4597520.1 HEAT repeat domain-containing protein [Pseudomonadota bacterium]MBV1739254.1 HEAT repeat domain-containing protein [Desulfarculus sp.]
MRKIVFSLMAVLTAAVFSWGFAPATALAQRQAPEFVLAKLQRTCQEAAHSGCQVKVVELTPEGIMALAGSQCYQVRGVAIYSLGEIGETRAVDLLIGMLQDPDRHIRRIAVRALGKIGDNRAVEPLVAVLNQQGENVTVRCTAAWALGQMGDPQACAALERMARAADGPLSVASREAVGNSGHNRAQALNSNL